MKACLCDRCAQGARQCPCREACELPDSDAPPSPSLKWAAIALVLLVVVAVAYPFLSS